MAATPRGQAACLGIIFFFVFAAYDTIQVYAKRLYPGDTGANSVIAVYTCFTVGCLFAAKAVSALGDRLSIAIGIMGYAALVLAGLVYLVTGYAVWLILLGGALLGCGAAILWTAQGSLILAYAGLNGSAERGRVFAIFWSLYRAAPLLGGVLSISYFSLHDAGQQAGSPTLFVIFLALIVAGGLATLLLCDPTSMHSGSSTARQPFLADTEAPPATGVDAASGAKPIAVGAGVGALATLRHMARDPSMVRLGLLFASSGYNEAYCLSELSRILSKRAAGIAQIAFVSAARPNSPRSASASACLWGDLPLISLRPPSDLPLVSL